MCLFAPKDVTCVAGMLGALLAGYRFADAPQGRRPRPGAAVIWDDSTRRRRCGEHCEQSALGLPGQGRAPHASVRWRRAARALGKARFLYE